MSVKLTLPNSLSSFWLASIFLLHTIISLFVSVYQCHSWSKLTQLLSEWWWLWPASLHCLICRLFLLIVLQALHLQKSEEPLLSPFDGTLHGHCSSRLECTLRTKHTHTRSSAIDDIFALLLSSLCVLLPLLPCLPFFFLLPTFLE